MGQNQNDSFALFVPDDVEPEKDLPGNLEVVDYCPLPGKSGEPLKAGAYNPYDNLETGIRPRLGAGNGTRRDLRKLSEWIKLKKEVEALNRADEDNSTD
jgi:hypothetical protein